MEYCDLFRGEIEEFELKKEEKIVDVRRFISDKLSFAVINFGLCLVVISYKNLIKYLVTDVSAVKVDLPEKTKNIRNFLKSYIVRELETGNSNFARWCTIDKQRRLLIPR